MSDELERYLKLSDAAAIVGCSGQHLRDEYHAHRLSLVNFGHGKKKMLRVREDELMRWAKSHPTAIPGRPA